MFKDVSGMKFGELTVINRENNDKYGRARWKCACSCGKEIITNGSNLLKGDSRSCGHTRLEFEDFTGMVFGELTVIEKSGKDKWGYITWRCKCSCGNETISSGHELKRFRKDCGDKIHRVRDLTGMIFGRLTVEKFVGTRKYKSIWLCRCECGQYKEINENALVSSNRKTCGHCSDADITGKTFGRLTAIKRIEKNRTGIIWEFKCSCGNIHKTTISSVVRGVTKSCGCLKREVSSNRWKTHGLSKTKEYQVFLANNRRERKKLYDTNWTIEMENQIRFLQPVCVVCGGDDRCATDHVSPLSKGNGLRPGNAARLCVHCNARKHDKSVGDLPKEVGDKIVAASKQFMDYWNLKTGDQYIQQDEITPGDVYGSRKSI